MTKSYMKAQLRKYQQTHPWARKLPKAKTNKSELFCMFPTEDYGRKQYELYWDRIEGDGSWAIVYDESRNGEWLWALANNGWADHICSECRYTINTDIHVGIDEPRCPRCGANMTGKHGITFTDNAIVLY